MGKKNSQKHSLAGSRFIGQDGRRACTMNEISMLNSENFPPQDKIDEFINGADLPIEKEEVLLQCSDEGNPPHIPIELDFPANGVEDDSSTGSETKRKRNFYKGTNLPFQDKQLTSHVNVLQTNIGEHCRRGETKVAVISVNPNGSFKCFGYSNIVAGVLRSNIYAKITFLRDSNGIATAFPPEDPVHFPILKSYCTSELEKLSTEALNSLLLVLQTSLDPKERKHLYRSHDGKPLETPYYWPPKVDYRSQYGNESILHQKHDGGVVFETRKQSLIYVIQYILYVYRERLWSELGVDCEGDEASVATQTSSIEQSSVLQQTESSDVDDLRECKRSDGYRFRVVKGGYKVICGCDASIPKDVSKPLNIHVCSLCNIRCHTLCCELKCLICDASPCKSSKSKM